VGQFIRQRGQGCSSPYVWRRGARPPVRGLSARPQKAGDNGRHAHPPRCARVRGQGFRRLRHHRADRCGPRHHHPPPQAAPRLAPRQATQPADRRDGRRVARGSDGEEGPPQEPKEGEGRESCGEAERVRPRVQGRSLRQRGEKSSRGGDCNHRGGRQGRRGRRPPRERGGRRSLTTVWRQAS
jgi:hypothetical protein